MSTFRKNASARAIAFEVAGLRELRAAHDAGGAPTAELTHHGEDFLETVRITDGRPSARDARRFGAELATTHAYAPTGSRIFGQAPEGFTLTHGFMGNTQLAVVPADAEPRSFGEFFAEDRLLPYVAAALSNGSFDDDDARVIEKLAERLRDGVFDSPQPKLVKTDAALLHGDLWNGNVMWAQVHRRPAPHGRDSHHADSRDPANQSTRGTLIDPACHGGHAESDLAQLAVFGSSHLEAIYDGYNEVSTLADGWEERIGLHKLYMLIIHAALFGGGYGRETVLTARQYL